MSAIRSLLSDCIDYAGLFPPASLDLQKTVSNYANYRDSPDAWALGRLVLPVPTLQTVADHFPEARNWPLSLIVRGDLNEQTLSLLSTFANDVAIECGPLPTQVIPVFARSLPDPAMVFVEADLSTDLAPTVAAIAGSGMRAKIRTGGLTSSAIPAPTLVARFIRCCIEHRVAFKATAGLHHATRGEYALTYENDSVCTTMHGFLNVLLASALLAEGADLNTAIALLDERSLCAFEIDQTEVRWRDHNFRTDALADMRKRVMLSFGSCSFSEPMDELRAAGLST